MVILKPWINLKIKGFGMQTHKVTISIPDPLYAFIERYQSEHQFKSRSEVISAALKLLQLKQLEAFYAEANQELNDDFEATTSDGVDDETW
jgi:antitoxin ParD1/3/4